MNTWKPLSEIEIEEIISEELIDCTPEQRSIFSKYAIPLSQYPIERYGNKEYVFVAAIKGNEAMYYEDVEEGWHFSVIPQEGGCLDHWCDQDELKYALLRWS